MEFKKEDKMKTKAKAKIRIDFKGYPGDDKIKNVCEKNGEKGIRFLWRWV
jgi:hypothetical protein